LRQRLGKLHQIAIIDLCRAPVISWLMSQLSRLLHPFRFTSWEDAEGRILHQGYSRTNVRRLLVRPLSRSTIPISLASSLTWPQTNSKKVLLVGPRFDSDYFLLRGHGFSRKHITLLDQFSTSHRIQVGDAHALPYPDSCFDIVILSWCLAYSSHPEQMVTESWRVLTQDGVLICCSDSYDSSERVRNKDHLDGADAPDLSSSSVLRLLPDGADILAEFDGPKNADGIRAVSCVAVKKS